LCPETDDVGFRADNSLVGHGPWVLTIRKVLSLEWKSEGVMDDESGESTEQEVPAI